MDNHSSNSDRPGNWTTQQVFEMLSAQISSGMRARLKEINKDRVTRLTQAGLAKRMGTAPSAISRLLKPGYNLTIQSISEFAAATESRCYIALVGHGSISEEEFNGTETAGENPAVSPPTFIRDEIIRSGILKRGTFSIEPVDPSQCPSSGLRSCALAYAVRRETKTEEPVTAAEPPRRIYVGMDFSRTDDGIVPVWPLFDKDGSRIFQSGHLGEVARVGAVILSFL